MPIVFSERLKISSSSSLQAFFTSSKGGGGTPSSSIVSKKKIRKRGRITNAALPPEEYGRENSNTIRVNERTLIDLSLDDSKHVAPNLGSDLAEQGSWLLAKDEALIGARAENIPLQLLVSTKPPHIISQICFTNIFGLVSSLESEMTSYQSLLQRALLSHLTLNKETDVADDQMDQVKCENRLDVDSFQEPNFTVNCGELVVRETSRVEGYNPECPDFPPYDGEAPPGESEGREENLIDVTFLQDLL
uniref:Uncharacterized protein n=1 Tax=Cannabis sativa TaxID=3483 RepID=A0A803P432_CANSA